MRTDTTNAPAAYEPNVFITNFRGQDLGNARTFGRVKAITKEPVIETFKLDVLARTVTDALADSHAEDWLICSGHMVLGIIASVEFLRRHRRLNLLLWHTKQKKYLPRVLYMRPDADAGPDSIDPVLSEILYSEVPVELA